MFKQKIENGYQKEVPDDWIKNGYPFEIKRSEYSYIVKFGGNVRVENVNGKEKFVQENYGSVKAIPYDMPVLGYENGMVNSLRIWDAEAITNFSLEQFDKGDYQKALEQENLAKTLVEVLYPNDNHYAGKELRLKQQYFFISAFTSSSITTESGYLTPPCTTLCPTAAISLASFITPCSLSVSASNTSAIASV